MNTTNARNVLARWAERQERRDGGDPTPRKVAAKQRAAGIAALHDKHGSVLDVGGEEWYWPFFADCRMEAYNLPDDMHAMGIQGQYDGAVAMHVLEHSPFPGLVLENIRHALKPRGWLYVAVPLPSSLWVRYVCHATMMAPDSWAHLFRASGWEIVHRERGRFGKSKQSKEERFLMVAT